jgi:hypothetical protein
MDAITCSFRKLIRAGKMQALQNIFQILSPQATLFLPASDVAHLLASFQSKIKPAEKFAGAVRRTWVHPASGSLSAIFRPGRGNACEPVQDNRY